MYHNPIMLNSAVENLKISGESIIIDATFGGGGHSKETVDYLLLIEIKTHLKIR